MPPPLPPHLDLLLVRLQQQGRLLLAARPLQVVHLLAQLGQLALQLLLLLQLLSQHLLHGRKGGPGGASEVRSSWR